MPCSCSEFVICLYFVAKLVMYKSGSLLHITNTSHPVFYSFLVKMVDYGIYKVVYYIIPCLQKVALTGKQTDGQTTDKQMTITLSCENSCIIRTITLQMNGFTINAEVAHSHAVCVGV